MQEDQPVGEGTIQRDIHRVVRQVNHIRVRRRSPTQQERHAPKGSFAVSRIQSRSGVKCGRQTGPRCIEDGRQVYGAAKRRCGNLGHALLALGFDSPGNRCSQLVREADAMSGNRNSGKGLPVKEPK